ncbi:MAG: CYTH domain-containing protein [Gammaproteobacteria bacterium]|nr:CYTH domain-containing protein [Gammaproteobacteria bacterium]
MATEIERKFLVRDETWRAQARGGEHYRQGYLVSAESCSIRVRRVGERGYLNIKSATLGVHRTEYDYEIPVRDAQEILDHLCVGPIIEKRRYFVDHHGHTWEVDMFEGDNAGLVVAEVELEREDEPVELPPWVGAEVSDDPRYYNVSLVTHPYKDW